MRTAAQQASRSKKLCLELRQYELRDATSEAKRKKIAKRLKVLEAFRESINKPEYMVLEIIPVHSAGPAASGAPGRWSFRDE